MKKQKLKDGVTEAAGTKKLTKTVVDALPYAEDQYFVFDSELKGFGVRVSRDTKSFIVQRYVNGTKKRVTLGRYGELTVIQAREQAQKMLGEMAKGVDPIKERREAKAQGETLQELHARYIAASHLAPATVKDYDRGMAAIGWGTKPWQAITGDMVAAKFDELSQRGGTSTNRDFRALRAILNFGIQGLVANGETPKPNPCDALKKRWHPTHAKTTTIKLHELAEWYKAISQLKHQTAKDYLLFTLLTGFRRDESASLTWKQIDFVGRTITLPDPKNHKAHVFPMSDFIYDMLKRRKADSDSAYVFPSDISRTGHYVEPKKAYAAIHERCGLWITIHDLRRTFGTVAAPLVTHAELKSMLNHKAKNDVTLTHYTHLSGEALREPVNRVTDALLRAMGLKEASNVVEFKKAG